MYEKNVSKVKKEVEKWIKYERKISIFRNEFICLEHFKIIEGDCFSFTEEYDFCQIN